MICRGWLSLVPFLALAACDSWLPDSGAGNADNASPVHHENDPPPELDVFLARSLDIAAPETGPGEATAEDELRSKAVWEASLAAGAQAGYARTIWELRRRVLDRSANAEQLDVIWDFRRVALPAPGGTGWILPPVILHSEGTWTGTADGQAAAAADRWYAISSPGRIVAEVPDWRAWLDIPFQAPKPIPPGLRPASDAETSISRTALEEGWHAGRLQAETAFEEALARLERDWTGMLEYHRLVAEGKMHEIVLDLAAPGTVVENDGSELRIGARTVRIVSAAAFQGNAEDWRNYVISAPDKESVRTGCIGAGQECTGF